jgi:hypothetical protein
MCVLEPSFKLSEHKKTMGVEKARQLLQGPRILDATNVIIKLRDKRPYGDALASFITRLASHDKKPIHNQLKAHTASTRRIPRTEVLLQQSEAKQNGEFIFLPFFQEEVMLSVRRPLNSFKIGHCAAGSVEVLCEMLENPERFIGKRVLADGDEVEVNGVRCVLSFGIREDGIWFIEPVPEKAQTTPYDRAFTIILPD